MKGSFLFTTALLFVCTAHAQYSKRIGLTIVGGANTAHYSLNKETSYNNRITNQGNVQQFQAGILVGIPLSKQGLLQTGLLVNGKGGKAQASSYYSLWEQSTSKPIYLEMPISYVYKFNIGQSFSLYAGAGIYGAIGVGGKNSYEGYYGEFYPLHIAETTKIHYGHHEGSGNGIYSSLQRFDYGFNFLGGASFKHIQLYCKYGLGMTDVHPKGYDADMGRNRVLSYGVGYTFTL